MQKNHLRVQDMTRIAMMTVVLAVCAWITVPGPVPFTLQTFGVFAALLLLGEKRGGLAILLYLLLGALGAPVFSGFSGGIGVLMGATGGYLLGFLLCVPAYALCRRRIPGRWGEPPGLVLGLSLCYGFGTAWFVLVYAGGSAMGFGGALLRCVVPFLLPDAAKLALAWGLREALRRRDIRL